MKSSFMGQKAHGNKNRFLKLTIGDLTQVKTMIYRRGHLRKVLQITIHANRIELIPLMDAPYKSKEFDRIEELRQSNTHIDKVLIADKEFGIL